MSRNTKASGGRIASWVKRLTRLAMQEPRLLLGSLIFLSLVFIAIFEPAIDHYRLGGVNPLSAGTYKRFLPPSYENPLGTDQWGRDLLAITLIGLRYSLLVGIISGSLATLIATIVALTAGWFRGLVDDVLNYVTNAVLVIPMFPIVLAIAASVRTGLIELCALLVFFSWPWAARAIRAQVLSLRNQPYIDLARVTNLRGLEIMFKEIFPNVVPFVIMTLAGSVIGAMVGETGLRLTGVGPPEIPTIGYLLDQSNRWGAIAAGRYNIVVPPILLLVLTFISLNLVNVGLDQAFNPKLKKVTGE